MRYHTFRGNEIDCLTANHWLEARFGTQVDPERIVATNGTQSALFLTLRTPVGAGNHVLTEELSYYASRHLAALLGITISGVAMDSDGANPEAFEEAIANAGSMDFDVEPGFWTGGSGTADAVPF